MGWFNHQPTNLRCDSSSSTERCISAWDELLIKHDVFFEPTNGRGIDSFDKYMVKKHPLKRAMLMAVSSIGCGIRPQDMIHHSTAYDWLKSDSYVLVVWTTWYHVHFRSFWLLYFLWWFPLHDFIAVLVLLSFENGEGKAQYECLRNHDCDRRPNIDIFDAFWCHKLFKLLINQLVLSLLSWIQGCFLEDLLGKGVVQEKGGVYVCLFLLRFCLFEHVRDGTWFIQDYDGWIGPLTRMAHGMRWIQRLLFRSWGPVVKTSLVP